MPALPSLLREECRDRPFLQPPPLPPLPNCVCRKPGAWPPRALFRACSQQFDVSVLRSSGEWDQRARGDEHAAAPGFPSTRAARGRGIIDDGPLEMNCGPAPSQGSGRCLSFAETRAGTSLDAPGPSLGSIGLRTAQGTRWPHSDFDRRLRSLLLPLARSLASSFQPPLSLSLFRSLPSTHAPSETSRPQPQ